MCPASRTKLCKTSAVTAEYPRIFQWQRKVILNYFQSQFDSEGADQKTQAAIIKHQICNLNKLIGVLLHFEDPYSKQLMKLQRMMSR